MVTPLLSSMVQSMVYLSGSTSTGKFDRDRTYTAVITDDLGNPLDATNVVISVEMLLHHLEPQMQMVLQAD